MDTMKTFLPATQGTMLWKEIPIQDLTGTMEKQQLFIQIGTNSSMLNYFDFIILYHVQVMCKAGEYMNSYTCAKQVKNEIEAPFYRHHKVSP